MPKSSVAPNSTSVLDDVNPRATGGGSFLNLGPIANPASGPTLTPQTTGGTINTTTYPTVYVAFSYASTPGSNGNATGETLISPVASVPMGSSLTVASVLIQLPTTWPAAGQINVYAGASSGSLYRVTGGSFPVAYGTNSVTLTSVPTSGTAIPSSNTSWTNGFAATYVYDNGSAPVSLTPYTMTAGTWSEPGTYDLGLVQLANGTCQVSLPNEAFASANIPSGASAITFKITGITGMQDMWWTYLLSGGGGTVTVGGYSSGQDPATYVLATPANKLATDSSGYIALQAGAVTSLVSAIWSALLTGITTAGSIGLKIKNLIVGGDGGIVLSSSQTAVPATVSGYAAGQDPATLLLVTPANKLATGSGGVVTVGVNNDKTGYGLTSGERASLAGVILADTTDTLGADIVAIKAVTDKVGVEIQSNGSGGWQFTANALALAPAGGGGSVTVGGYAAGQDPATLLLASPTHKLATDASGNVTVGSYATGQDPGSLVLVTPANKLATATGGKVSEVVLTDTTTNLTNGSGGSGTAVDGGTVSASPSPTATTFTATGNLNAPSGGYVALPQQILWLTGANRGQRFVIAGHTVSGSNHSFTLTGSTVPASSGDTFNVI